MRLNNKLILLAALCKLKVKADSGIIGNLAFYGRGQRHLPNYWNDNDKIVGSVDARVYFPYNESDESTEVTSEITDNAKNNPLVLYLPGIKNRIFTKLDFYVLNDERTIDLTSFHRIKSEIKLVPPKVDELISEGYTCESIGLTCTDLKDYDFDANTAEWLSKADIQFYLESVDANNDDDYDESEKYLFHYKIEGGPQPSNNWSEFIGNIDKSEIINSDELIYTDFVIRNYGKMPVYVYIGNTIFLKKDPTYMVREGEIQNNFANWSWHRNTADKTATYFANQVYEGDEEKKNCVKFQADEDGDFGYYVHIENGISAPPEGVSFKIRPMNDNQFIFKIDNKKEFNLTDNYLIHRNCKIPIGEETTFLVDVRSLVYSDPKFMLTNDISGFWLQTISEINNIKKNLAITKGQEIADNYHDVMYFYDFTLHHTFPENTTIYVKQKLFDKGPECSIKLETHEDWGDKDNVNIKNPVIQWPDDLSLDTIFNSKNTFEVIGSPDLYAEGESEQQGGTQTVNGENCKLIIYIYLYLKL